jgi:hypothetical protein
MIGEDPGQLMLAALRAALAIAYQLPESWLSQGTVASLRLMIRLWTTFTARSAMLRDPAAGFEFEAAEVFGKAEQTETEYPPAERECAFLPFTRPRLRKGPNRADAIRVLRAAVRGAIVSVNRDSSLDLTAEAWDRGFDLCKLRHADKVNHAADVELAAEIRDARDRYKHMSTLERSQTIERALKLTLQTCLVCPHCAAKWIANAADLEQAPRRLSTKNPV